MATAKTAKPTVRRRTSATPRRMVATRRGAKPKRSPRAALRAARVYKKLTFGSRASLVKSLKSVRVNPDEVGVLLDTAKRESPTRANSLATALLGKRMAVGEARDLMRGLVRWGAIPTSDAVERRRTVFRAFKANRSELLLVHGISELAPSEAQQLMRSYFDEGGDMQPVAQWLQLAGSALKKTAPAPLPTIAVAPVLAVPRLTAAPRRVASTPRRSARGWFEDALGAVGNFLSDAANAVVDLVSTVVNAVISAGKSIADAISAAISWTIDQLSSLVRALISVGKTVAAILSEALVKGVIGKFVQAILQAGRAIGEVLAWAVQRTAAAIRDAVAGILAAGRAIFDVLSWAAYQAIDLATKIIEGLIAVGKTVAQVMADIVRFAAMTLRKLVGAIYRALQTVGSILAAAAQCAWSVIRTVLEGLFMVGVTLAKTVASIFADVVAGFRRGFVEGLIALGHAVLDILKAALFTGLAVLMLAFGVIMEIFGGHRGLTTVERAEARRVFGWSIDLDRVKIAVASIPADIVNWVNGQRPFTTMYVINFASWAHVTLQTLIHELTHVWQAVVVGPVYMVEALHSQLFGRGYNVTDADIAAANGDLSKLEREQQAVVVERYWQGRWGGGGWPWQDYESLAQDVYKAQRVRPFPIFPMPFPLALTIFRGGRRARRITLQTFA